MGIKQLLPGYHSPDMSPVQQADALRDIRTALDAGERSKNAIGTWVVPDTAELAGAAEAQAAAALTAIAPPAEVRAVAANAVQTEDELDAARIAELRARIAGMESPKYGVDDV